MQEAIQSYDYRHGTKHPDDAGLDLTHCCISEASDESQIACLWNRDVIDNTILDQQGFFRD